MTQKRRFLPTALPALLLLTTASACAHLPGYGQATGVTSARPAPAAPRPVVRFPSEAELDAIVAQAPPMAIESAGGRTPIAVDRWDLEEAPAAGDPVYEALGPMEALLTRLASSEGIALRRSQSLRCAAREMARFQMEHDGPTTSRLGRHLLSACGSAARNVGTFSLSFPARYSPADVAEDVASRMSRSIRQNLARGSWVGIGFARDRGTATMVIAFAEPKVEVTPWTAPEAANHLRLTGTLRMAGTRVTAAITSGAHGLAVCTVDNRLTAPSFALDCPMAADDTEALVEVMLTDANSLERRVLAALTIQRDPSRARPFAPTRLTEDDAPTSAVRVVSFVNARRAEAGLGPLALAEAQSARHQLYASALFGLSAAGGGEALNDLILGLMAGWRVQGPPIRNAGSVWMREEQGTNLARVIGGLLETPSGRSALLSPNSRQLAVGIVEGHEPKHLGLVLTSYEFFEGLDHRADAAKVVNRLSRLRQRRGLPPVTPLGELPALSQAATSVAERGTWPEVALRTGLDQDSTRMSVSLQASHIEAVTLDALPYPIQAINAAHLNASVVVTHTQAPGAAWGQYVIYLIMR